MKLICSHLFDRHDYRAGQSKVLYELPHIFAVLGVVGRADTKAKIWVRMWLPYKFSTVVRCGVRHLQTADCRLADYISCYLYEYTCMYTIYTYTSIYTYTYIPIPIRSASLANRSSSLANPSASLQVCSLQVSHTASDELAEHELTLRKYKTTKHTLNIANNNRILVALLPHLQEAS